MKSQNPWFTIWTQPRATIAKVVEENHTRDLWWLAAIYGFCSLMNMFQSMVLGNAMGTIGILVIGVILAPFWGWINFSIWSWFVLWVGKLFKGGGNFKTVRSAYAWSCVPITLNVPLWLLMIFLFGHQLFLNFPDAHFLRNGQVVLLFAILVFKVIIAVWSLVIYLNALAEVQNYSVLRAILNVIVAAVILGVVLFILWSLLVHALDRVAATAFLLWKLF